MASYSLLDLAYDVLKESARPGTYQEIRQMGSDAGLAAKLRTSGKTPWQQNTDFEKFLPDVKIDFESKRVHRAEFDEVLKNIKEYVRVKLKIQQVV